MPHHVHSFFLLLCIFILYDDLNQIRKISICISSNLIERKKFLDNPLLAIEGVDILNGKMHSGEIISRNLAFTSRTQYGLPTGSIVFGNFNQLYKLDRQTFHLWLDIVTEISGSVLWLLRYPAEAEAYLRNEAEEYGLLIFLENVCLFLQLFERIDYC